MTEKQPARYVFSVEVEGSTVLETALDGFVGYGEDAWGALAEGLRVSGWLQTLSDNFGQAAREEFNGGTTRSDLQE